MVVNCYFSHMRNHVVWIIGTNPALTILKKKKKKTMTLAWRNSAKRKVRWKICFGNLSAFVNKLLVFILLLCNFTLLKIFGLNFKELVLSLLFPQLFSYFEIFWCFAKLKRCAIITYKHGIYELPHKFPHDLWLIRN